MAAEVTFRKLEPEYQDKIEKMFGKHEGGVVEFNPGRVIMPEKYIEVAQRIKDMEVKPDDVWLVSFPRTGSTWTQEMVWCIGNDCDFEKAQMLQNVRAPVLELTTLLSNDDSGLQKLMGDTVSMVENMPSPRFIKTHLPVELLPKQLFVVKPKIVYVYRNPKDMCVSFYHYCKLLHDMKGSIEDFCELFINDKAPMGPIFNHILGFWALRNEPNILFVRYEDLKKDLKGGVLRMAKFLEKDLSEEQINGLLNHLSFDSMKKNPAVNLEPILEYRKNVLETEAKMTVDQMTFLKAPSFIRKGQVGDHANHMSPEMIKRFDEWTAKNLEGTGLTM